MPSLDSGTIHFQTTSDAEPKVYTWHALGFPELEELERIVGPVIGEDSCVNTVRGRIYITYLAVHKAHPNLTPGEIRGWEPTALNMASMTDLVFKAIPFLRISYPASNTSGDSDSPSTSLPTSTSTAAGPPAPPDASPSETCSS